MPLNFTTLTLRDAIEQELLTSLATDFDMLESCRKKKRKNKIINRLKKEWRLQDTGAILFKRIIAVSLGNISAQHYRRRCW